MAEDGRLHIVIDGDASEFKQTLREVTEGFRDVKTEASELSRRLDSSMEEAGKSTEVSFESVQKAIDQTFSKIDEAAGTLKSQIRELEAEYQELKQVMAQSYETGKSDRDMFQVAERVRAIEKELRVRRDLLGQVSKQADALAQEEQGLRKLQQETEKTSMTQSGLRKRMRELTMQLVELEAAGQRGSEAYQKLQAEAGRLRDSFADAQKQVQIMAHDNAGLQGVISAVSGVAGAFSAAQGVIGLFGDKNEELQKTMLKVQSLMSITMGLQQVANTLNKDSFLNVAILQKVRAAYNAELAKSVPALGATTAAQTAENASAAAGTVANTGLAASFRAVGAAIKAIPVIGWIIAGISALIAAVSLFTKKTDEEIEAEKRQEEELERTKQKYEEFKNAVSNSVGNVVGKYKVLQKKYKELSSDMEKTKWIKDNSRAFKDMGLAITDVNSAEAAFVSQTDLVIEALKTRAEAQALETMYQQQYAKQVAAQLEKDRMIREAGGQVAGVRSGTATGYRDEWRAAGLDPSKDVSSTTTGHSTNYGYVSSTTYQLTPSGEAKMKAYYESLAETAGQALVDKAGEDISTIEGLWSDATRRAEEARARLRAAGLAHDGDGGSGSDKVVTQEQVAKEYLALLKKNQDAEIALLEDGAEKQRRLVNLEYERQEQALVEMRRLWASANADGNLTPEQESALTNALQLAQQKRDNALAKIAKDEEDAQKAIADKSQVAFIEFLKDYGSFQDKRLAIAKEYAAKIKKAQEEGNVFEVASLQNGLKKAIADIDAEELMDKVDLSMVFSDLGMVLVGPLKKTVDELRAYTKTDKFKGLNLEDQKQVFEAIAKAEKELGGLSGLNFSGLGDAMRQYNLALSLQTQKQLDLTMAAQALAAAEEELEAAMQGNDEAAKNLATTNRDAALQQYNAALDDYNAASSKVISTQANATASLQKFNAAVSSLEGGIKKLMNGQLSGLFDMLGPEFAQKLGMLISGGENLKRQANDFIASLAANGKDLQSFSKEASQAFSQLFANFEGTFGDATSKANELISELLGEGIGKDIKKDISDQIGNLLSEAIKDGVIDEKALKDLGDGVGSLLSALGEAGESSGNVWGIIIGLVLTLLDEFKENGIGDLVEGLLVGVADAVEGILENLFDDIFTHLINGIEALLKGILMGVVKLIANIFTLGTMSEEIAHLGEHGITDEQIDVLVKSNESLTKALNELKNTIKNGETTNKDAQAEYKRSREMLEENLRNTRRLMTETAAAWSNGFLGIGGSHSSKHHINTEVSRSSWDAISKVVGRSVRDADAFFNLTAEEMKKVSLYATSAYGEILAAADAGYKGASQYIQQYAELAGQLEELQFSLYEKLTGVSWDSFYSDFKSMLKDMDSDAEKFADQFNEYMSDAILESLANEKYRDRMKALYKKFAEAMSDESAGGSTLTEAEIDALRREREAIVNDALAERERLIQAGLITGSSEDDERKGASKSSLGASQDSIDESNARLTTIQGHTYMINENVNIMRQQHVALLGITSGILAHVTGIHGDTTKLNEKTDALQQQVSALRSDVGRIVTNGVIIKR